MDLSATKKRKAADENGAAVAASAALTLEDAQKIIASFTLDQLKSIVAASILDSPLVLNEVRSIADKDPAHRKLFIRGLGWDTTTESLRALFSSFGDLEEAVVICDKATGKSKGYGFITFRHIDGAILALKEPSKKIDGRITVTQLASAGNTGTGPATGPVAPAADVSMRKVYVGNVPPDMQSDRLLSLFSVFGEIEEGPLGLDKQTGKFRGYALFVYKTVEGASSAIAEPMKIVDGHHMICKLAIDGKRKPGMNNANANNANNPVSGFENKPGDGLGGYGSQSSMPGSIGNQYGGPGSGSGFSSYGLPGPGGMGHHHHLNSPMQSSVRSGLSGQAPAAMGGSGGGGYGSGGGYGGPYGSSAQFSGGPGSGGYGGLGTGMGSSAYNRMPPSAGGFSEGGPYSLSSLGHSGSHHQSMGSPPGPRVPPGGGMYQGMPPYY